MSSFTGSAGTALITGSEALLWTDGRYFNQASKELAPGWTLMRSETPGVPTINEWLSKNIPCGKSVGVDAFLISASTAEGFVGSGISLVSIGGFLFP